LKGFDRVVWSGAQPHREIVTDTHRSLYLLRPGVKENPGLAWTSGENRDESLHEGQHDSVPGNGWEIGRGPKTFLDFHADWIVYTGAFFRAIEAPSYDSSS